MKRLRQRYQWHEASPLPVAANKERAPPEGAPKVGEMITNAVRSGHGTAARKPSGKGCQVVYGRSVQKNDRVRAKTGAGLIDYVAE